MLLILDITDNYKTDIIKKTNPLYLICQFLIHQLYLSHDNKGHD